MLESMPVSPASGIDADRRRGAPLDGAIMFAIALAVVPDMNAQKPPGSGARSSSRRVGPPAAERQRAGHAPVSHGIEPHGVRRPFTRDGAGRGTPFLCGTGPVVHARPPAVRPR